MAGKADFTAETFRIWVQKKEKHDGVTYIRLRAKDRFSTARHALERRSFSLFTQALEGYLRRRPYLHFEHPKNIVRKIVYLPPALKSWAAYMPGGFATYYVHNPDHKRLVNGRRIDYLTRNLFRHATDAVGLRSRAYAMAWFLHEYFHEHAHINWVSIACGTGQPTFDAAQLFRGKKSFYLIDLNPQALDFAKQLADGYGIRSSDVTTLQLDIKDDGEVRKLLSTVKPHIVEAMGLFEYLGDQEAVELLVTLKTTLPHGSVFVFTNMHAGHPQLQVHKRGLGWPGVIPRTTDEVLKLLKRAGFRPEQITVLLPDDNVYAVYGITS